MAFSDDFSTMQEEAMRRVREMQRRSRSMVGTPGQEPPPGKPPDPAPSAAGGKGPLSFLGDMKLDEEKALIGLLIYILYKQGADVKLLLALGALLL